MLSRKAGAVGCLVGLVGWGGSTGSGCGNAAGCKGSSAAPVIPTELPWSKLLAMLVPVSLTNPAAKPAGRRLGAARGVAWAGDSMRSGTCHQSHPCTASLISSSAVAAAVFVNPR